MMVTTGARGSSRPSSTSSSGSSSSSSIPTISASYPNSPHRRVNASSDNDCVAVAISPSPISVFTTSAGDRCALSAPSPAAAPPTSFNAGREGLAAPGGAGAPTGAGTGVGAAAGATGGAGGSSTPATSGSTTAAVDDPPRGPGAAAATA